MRGNGFDRDDVPVKLTGDFSSTVRVVEVDDHDQPIGAPVPSQVDFRRDLTFIMSGHTPADGARLYYVYLGEREPPDESKARNRSKPAEESAPAEPAPLVAVRDGVMHQGQESVVINTPGGVYYYHKQGGGFASMIDQEGHDWINYRPEDAGGGERGIPNLGPDGLLSPGGSGCDSRLLADGPLVARIHTNCQDGAWEAEWEIYPRFARLTVIQTAHPYSFLYEGTPGGAFDPGGDYWVRADGTRASAAQSWQGRLERPRWIYFGDPSLERVLYLVHQEDDGTSDEYRPVDDATARFGFGRRGDEASLEHTPAEFTIGFAAATGHAAVTRIIDSAYRNLIISKGAIEQRGQ